MNKKESLGDLKTDLFSPVNKFELLPVKQHLLGIIKEYYQFSHICLVNFCLLCS